MFVWKMISLGAWRYMEKPVFYVETATTQAKWTIFLLLLHLKWQELPIGNNTCLKINTGKNNISAHQTLQRNNMHIQYNENVTRRHWYKLFYFLGQFKRCKLLSLHILVYWYPNWLSLYLFLFQTLIGYHKYHCV